MSRSFTREETRRLASILADTAQAEVMPRFHSCPGRRARIRARPGHRCRRGRRAHDQRAAGQAVSRRGADRRGSLDPQPRAVEHAGRRRPGLPDRPHRRHPQLRGGPAAVRHDDRRLPSRRRDRRRNLRPRQPRQRAGRARRRRMDGIRERQAGAAGRGQSRAARGHGRPDTGALPEPLRSTVNGNLSKLGSTASLRCAAHEYRMLAAGHCHVALYNQLTAWDHAAGWLLHREAAAMPRASTVRRTSPRTAAAACCTRPTRAAGMPRSALMGGISWPRKAEPGRVRPRPESHFPGLRLGLSRSYPHYLWTTLWKAL